VQAAGLTGLLERNGPYTLFAPTDGPFKDLPDGALQELLGDKEKLNAALKQHTVPELTTTLESLGSRELKNRIERVSKDDRAQRDPRRYSGAQRHRPHRRQGHPAERLIDATLTARRGRSGSEDDAKHSRSRPSKTVRGAIRWVEEDSTG
jgi:uncharacterized surface protein with fasciclin (FAS1) repeats